MTDTQRPPLDGLSKVGGRPPLGQYLKEVWDRREFIVSLGWYRIEAENGRTKLGLGWLVLKPIINAIIYGTIFGILLGRGARAEHYIPFLVIGVFMFEFFGSCFTQGSKSITANAALLQSLSFPRMSLPLAKVVQNFLQFIPMLVVMLIIVMIFGISPQLEWLLFIPVLLIFTIFNTGLALITARLTVHFRDLTQLLPFVSRFFFYTSGIFFSVEKRFEDHDTVIAVAGATPIHEYLTLGRDVLLPGSEYVMHTNYWYYGTAWAVATLIIGIFFFWAAEERYGRTD